jgi:hypothetical protein
LYPLWLMKKALISERKQASGFPRPLSMARNLCKRWGSTPKKSHLVSPLSTNVGRRHCGRTRSTWSSKYRVGCGGQPRAAPRSHRHAPQSQCGGLEGGPQLVLRASSRHVIHLWSGIVTMRSRQLLFFAGRDEGAEDLIVLEGEDT